MLLAAHVEVVSIVPSKTADLKFLVFKMEQFLLIPILALHARFILLFSALKAR